MANVIPSWFLGVYSDLNAAAATARLQCPPQAVGASDPSGEKGGETVAA